MKHIQPKTLQIMVAVLSTGRFSQRGIWRLCNRQGTVSIGQVNKVVKDLQQKGFVERLWKSPIAETMEMAGPIGEDWEDFNMGRANYALTDPIGLLRFISLFRSMRELRLFTISVEASEEKIIKELLKKDAIICLGTAMERYSAYYRPDEVSFYSGKPEAIYKYLRTAKGGFTKVSCYKIDYVQGKTGGPTTDVQTVVDMFCDGKGVYTKPLLRKFWGVDI